MGCVRAHQAGAAGRRKRAQIAADVTRGKSKRAHAGDLQMREVLANPTPLFEEGLDRRGHLGRLGVKAEVLMDAGGEIEDRLEQRPSRSKGNLGVGGQLRLGGDADRIEDELVSVQPLLAVIARHGVAHRLPGWRFRECEGAARRAPPTRCSLPQSSGCATQAA